MVRKSNIADMTTNEIRILISWLMDELRERSIPINFPVEDYSEFVTGVVAVPYVNVRREPSINAEIMGVVVEGTSQNLSGSVEVENDGFVWRQLVAGGWLACRIIHNGQVMVRVNLK